mgnify:CR=1 FL=1
MKKKKLLQSIMAIMLVLFTLFSSMTAMAEPLAEAVTEVTEAAEKEEQETFIYPEEKTFEEDKEEAHAPDEELREPDVAEQTETDEFGEPVVISEHSKIYQTGDNTFKTVYSEIPNTFKKNGKQKEYDNTLVLKEKVIGQDYYTNKQSDIDVKLPAEIKENKGITFEYGKTKVDLIPTEGDYSKSAVKENAILYNDVYDGIDVQYTIHELGLKEDIILNKHIDKTVFTYKLDTHGAEARLENGVINLYEKKSDEPALTLSAPMMTDADAKVCENVELTLIEEKGEYVVTVIVDKDWLDDAERAYPVKIDPNFTVPSSKFTVVTTSEYRGVYEGLSYGYVGHLTDDQVGAPGTGDFGKTRMYFHIDDDFSSIPEGSKINSASLRIYQYMNYNGGKTKYACFRLEDSWKPSKITWDTAIKLNQSPSGENSISKSAVGFHNFDCRETVNNWVQGIQDNNGLVVQALDETDTGSPFFTPLSKASNPGQDAFTPDKAPQLIIDWEVPNPVDPNYPLDETTINLRTIIETNKDGLLRFHAIFADGVAQPGAIVSYKLNDSSKKQNGTVVAAPSYKYPDSLAWSKYFPARATKYKDILSNWQTIVPFTDTTFNTIYQYSATAEKDGVKGNTAKSDEFLIYKIKQYDVLSKIANYYGVPLQKIMFDNRVQDLLLIENNTIVIINPTKNGNRPYNPEPLTDSDKRKIDSLLMGRGKHCEFGMEPINLNTGNFYFNTEDISIPDLNGDFNIERTYNSKGAGYNSSFGRGWHFEYDEYISKLENGTYVYSRGDGSAIYFEPNGKGGYTCPDGYNLTFTPVKIGEKEGDFGGEELEKYNVYEYEVKSADGEVRRFNTMGMLTKITDAKGFVTLLAYDKEYNLKSITSPAGTIYSFTYTEDGYIKTVTLPNGKTLNYTYDDNNNLASYKDANGNEIKYAYDSKHQMTSWTDAEGNVIVTNTYDNEGRVAKQVDANGAVSTLAYTNGKTTTTDANGNVTVYNYDNQYRTTKIEYPNGSTEVKTYDNSNNLASVTDQNGNKTEYTYNNDGYVLSKKRFDGAVKKYEYNSDNQITKITDYDGKTTSYEYSSKDVVKQTNNNGTALTFAYDNKHRMIKSTDANGNVSEYTYSGAFLSSFKNAEGKTTKYAYNLLGQIVSITNANDEITRFTYDNAGRKLTQQTADGAITKYVYDKAGCVTSITDPKSNAFAFTYDGLGNILTATDPYDKTISYEYDGNGNKIGETDAEGNKTVYTYDNMNNLVSVTDADGNVVTYAYDNSGNQISSTDANSNISNTEYDYRFNQPSKVINGAGETLSYEYDAVGNITKITYPNGSSISTSYDDMNRLAQTVAPSGLETTYSYDANGNVLTISDNTGRTITSTYDVMNRTTKTVMPNACEILYTYDNLGRLTEQTDAMGGKTKYIYDVVGNITSVEDQLGRVTAYEYDLNGNIIKMTAPNGAVTQYAYNAYDLASKVTDGLDNATDYAYDGNENITKITDVFGNEQSYKYNANGLVTKYINQLGNEQTITYDGNGNVTAVKDARGNTSTFEYDSANRTAKAVSAEGLTVEYTYNSLGMIEIETDNTGSSNTYTYDDAGRLIKVEDALGQTVEYTYDKRDNITSVKNTDGTVTNYTYDVMNNVVAIKDAEGKVTTYTYDANGNLLSNEDNAHRVWAYTYDAVGRLTKSTNPLNESTSYAYNAIDQLTSTTNPKNLTKSYEYDILGNLLSATDENGNKTSYEYDALYRLINTTAADGGKQEFLYDAASQLVKFKDALGNITQYGYDANGNLTSLTNPNGGVYAYAYNKDNYQTTITDPLENVTASTYDLAGRLTKKTLPNNAEYTYSYDAIGRIIAQTAPEGLSKAYAYDEAGNLASETDQSNRTTSYTYDIMHRLTSSTNAKGAATTLTYDNRGNLSTITSPKGNTTTYEYDVLDRISKSLDPVGRVEEYTYDPVGNVTEITKNGGRAYSYTYDNVGNLTSAKNPMEQVQSFTYDSMNRLTSETDLAGKATSYTYDLNGQLTSVKDRNNAVTSYTYDANGNVTSITDPENRRISYTYDLLDRIINVTEGETQTAQYEYDSVGNLTKYIDGNNKTTTYTYNKLGEMTSITDPLGKVKEFSYNVNAMLDTVTNPDGSTVNYDYDVLDELIGKRYDNEEDPQALYGYDIDGNRISMDDVAGTTEYEYDEVGRITAVNLSNGKQIKYAYDEYGNISKLTYPDNTTVQYTYNELDQITQIKDRQGKVTKYDRDANGNITKVTRPNNTYSTIEYDDMGNVIKVVNMGKNPYYDIEEELSAFAYTYDKSGFITGEIAKNGKRIETNQYQYDERGQLVKVSQTVTENNKFVEETEMVYTYDGAGNRLSAVKTSGDKALCNILYTYNDNSQITDIESDCDDNKQTHVILTYDENGNLKNTTCNDTEKVRDYTYDNENRLKAVKENGSLLMAALYDGNGDRIFRLDYRKNSDYVSNQAGTAENVYYPSCSVNSAYDTDVILNEMLIPNGVTNNTAINYELTGYINDINTEYTQTLMAFGANGNTTNVYEYGDGRNSATINGTKGYYLYDGRGSVAGLTGNSGGSMITYRYDVYGNTIKSNNTLNNPYQYNAEYTDSSTGLQYLRARYYDSSQGRFTTKDTYLGTVSNPLSRNLYTYVENNPLNYIDPSGHLVLRGTDSMRNMPLISPMDQMKIDRQIQESLMDPFSKGRLILDPKERQAFYDKQIENIYGDYLYGPSYSKPTAPYRYDPVKNPFGEGKNPKKKKEAQTKLQKAIENTKQENYKKYCENGVSKAKDDGGLDHYYLDKNSREYLIEALERAKRDVAYQPYLDMIDSIIDSLKSGNEVVDLGNGVKVQINLNKNYSTKGDQLIKEFAGFIPVLGELMDLIDFMDTDNSSLNDLGDSAASSTVGGLAKFLEKNDNSFLKGLGKTLGKITNIYNVVKITEIVFDKNEDNYKATEIQIVLQKKGSSSSHLYHVVVDKDGNFKEMYSGYAGDVIKDDNYFEVITE